MTHICVSKLTIIGSANGLSPGRRHAIIWTNARILLIGPLGTNFSEILIGIQTFSFKKMHLKMSSAKRRPFCLGLNVLSVESDSLLGFPPHLTGVCWNSLNNCLQNITTKRINVGRRTAIWYIWGPVYSHGLSSIPAWINNHMSNKVRDKITYIHSKTSTSEPLKCGGGWMISVHIL